MQLDRSFHVESQAAEETKKVHHKDIDDDYSEDEFEMILKDKDIRFMVQDTLIILSYRLPYKFSRDKQGRLTKSPSHSLIYQSMIGQRKQGHIKFTWIGFPGINPASQEERRFIEESLKQDNCVPVFIE